MAKDKNKTKSQLIELPQTQQSSDKAKFGLSFFYMFVLLMLVIIVILSLNSKIIEQNLRSLMKSDLATRLDWYNKSTEQLEEEAPETEAMPRGNLTDAQSESEIKIIEKIVEVNKCDIKKLHNMLDKYRLLIANIARLHSDFIQKQDLATLDYLEKNTSGCSELQNFLQELRDYLHKYAEQNPQFIKIGEGRFAEFTERFVKVEKSPSYQRLHSDFMFSYVLSEKFMRKYIKL